MGFPPVIAASSSTIARERGPVSVSAGERNKCSWLRDRLQGSPPCVCCRQASFRSNVIGDPIQYKIFSNTSPSGTARKMTAPPIWVARATKRTAGRAMKGIPTYLEQAFGFEDGQQARERPIFPVLFQQRTTITPNRAAT